MAFLDSLVAPFKQRGIVKGADKAVSYGICVGLSVDWICRHRSHKSEGSQKRIHYMGTQAPALSVASQLAYKAKLTETREGFGSGQKQSVNAAFASRGVAHQVRDTEWIRHVSADRDTALQELFVHTSGVHNYYIIMLQFDNGGDAHATAAYHSSGKMLGYGSHLYYFEPNYGEFKLSPRNIKSYFTDLAAQYMQYRDKAGNLDPKKLTSIAVNAVACA